MIASAGAGARSPFAVLVAAIFASSMSYIDITALTVALPIVKAKLPASDSQAQWIVEGYLLFLSALILIGDKLGLYRAMADGAAVTPAELAARTGTSARYVREWLNANVE